MSPVRVVVDCPGCDETIEVDVPISATLAPGISALDVRGDLRGATQELRDHVAEVHAGKLVGDLWPLV